MPLWAAVVPLLIQDVGRFDGRPELDPGGPNRFMTDEKLTRAKVREEIRWFLAEHLPAQEPNQRQADSQVNSILTFLYTLRGFSPKQVKEATPVILEELHRLLIGGVIRSGHKDSFDLPWLTVTEWGMKALTSEGPPIYDPDGYLDHVRAAVPTLPEVAGLYLGEAVAAFNLVRTLSAAVMLGVAAEAVLVHLIGVFAASIHATNGPKLQMSLEMAPITQTFNEFIKQLDEKALPADLRRDLDVYLGTVRNYILMTRNEAGHPTGVAVGRPVIEAQLRAFEGYAKRLCALADYFAQA